MTENRFLILTFGCFMVLLPQISKAVRQNSCLDVISLVTRKDYKGAEPFTLQYSTEKYFF
jgi:hypothetical protein